MKKTIAILSAFVALVACNKTVVPEQENPVPEDKQELKINFTVTRADINDTKATVKTGWAENDVVFVFFNGVAAPKYLEMKYDGTTWNTELKGMTADDLADAAAAADRRMTAVYLPYGSAYTVGADGTAFTIKNGEENYSGHFYIDEQKTYTFVSSILSGKIELSAAQPASGSDKLVHFDVSQYTDGHTYAMYQENMKPISLSSIAADGEVATAEGTVGDALPGYIDADNSIISFSGVLESATGAKNWWFSIRDTEDGTLYYRDGGSKTVESNMYIGLGKLTAWNVATPGVFTVSAGGDKITIARSNLSYRGTLAEKKWQLMKYPWSMIEPRSSASDPQFKTKSNVDFGLFSWGASGWSESGDETWENFRPWSVRNTEQYTEKNPKYSNNTYAYGPAYDAVNQYGLTGVYAHGDWGVHNTIYSYGGGTLSGSWRTPTNVEWAYLIGRGGSYVYAKALVEGVPGLVIFPDAFSVPSGITVNSANVSTASPFSINTYPEYQWNKIEAAGAVFLPASGTKGYQYSQGDQIQYVNHVGVYWSTTVISASKAYDMYFSDGSKEADENTVNTVVAGDDCHRYLGAAVRLVRDLVNIGNYDTWNDNDI